jgi:hypothetical protein
MGNDFSYSYNYEYSLDLSNVEPNSNVTYHAAYLNYWAYDWDWIYHNLSIYNYDTNTYELILNGTTYVYSGSPGWVCGILNTTFKINSTYINSSDNFTKFNVTAYMHDNNTGLASDPGNFGTVQCDGTSVQYTGAAGSETSFLVHTRYIFQNISLFVPYNTTINASLGQHTLKLYISSNSTYMNEVTFGIYNYFNVSIESPVNNTLYNTSFVDLNWSSNVPISSCAYELDQNGTNVTLSGNITLGPLSGGNHNVSIYCNDTGGNIAHSDLITWSIDAIEPTIIIQSPINNTTYSYLDIDLNWSVSETTSWCAYELNQNGTNTTITTNITLSSLSEGNHNVSIHCNDTAGNIGYSGLVLWSIDATLPTITIISPVNNTIYSTSSVNLTWTTSETIDWCAYELNQNGTNVTITTNITLTLAEASYNLSMYCNDTVGNIGQSGYVFWNVSIPSAPVGGGGGGGPSIFERILIYNFTEQQLLDITCGNRVCDINENPRNCPDDCPVNLDEVISGRLFGQYWFVQLLVFFITGVIIWTLISGKVKRKKNVKK